MLIVMAHPDDEVIFGWPVLKDAKKIICCSNDLYNPKRQWCKDRVKALNEIGEMLRIKIVCFYYSSEFYRLNARNGELKTFADGIIREIDEDTVFTHNAWGEYGHLDHILVNQIVKSAGKRILTTDICLKAGWFDTRVPIYGKQYDEVEIDRKLYDKCEAIYRKYNAWTWSKPPVEKTRLYYENN